MIRLLQSKSTIILFNLKTNKLCLQAKKEKDIKWQLTNVKSVCARTATRRNKIFIKQKRKENLPRVLGAETLQLLISIKFQILLPVCRQDFPFCISVLRTSLLMNNNSLTPSP